MSQWEDRLLREAREIVNHGQGKLSFNVGPLGQDKTNILVEAGKTHRFIIEKVVLSTIED